MSSRFIMLKDFGVKANVRTIRKKTKVAKERQKELQYLLMELQEENIKG